MFISSISNVIVACCLCLYVCGGPELETPYKQAAIRALRQNISLWRAGPEGNKSMKMYKILFPITKYWGIEHNKKLENLCYQIFFNTYFITKIWTFPTFISLTYNVIIACCLCFYVCAGPELETPCKQATITALRQNTSVWRAGPERNESMKMCKILLPIMKYWT